MCVRQVHAEGAGVGGRGAQMMPPLTDEQRDDVERNIGLAYRVAERCAGALPKDDAKQAAVLGLMRAMQKYDGRARLSTYSEYWTRAAVSIEKQACACRPAALPVSRLPRTTGARLPWILHGDALLNHGRILKHQEHVYAETGAYPSVSETSAAVGIDEWLVSILVLAGLPYVLIDDYDTLQDDKAKQPDDVASDANRAMLVSVAVASLHAREAEVIRYRFWESLTLEQVGHKFGVTRGRIYQIEAKALRKLRVKLKSLVD